MQRCPVVNTRASTRHVCSITCLARGLSPSRPAPTHPPPARPDPRRFNVLTDIPPRTCVLFICCHLPRSERIHRPPLAQVVVLNKIDLPHVRSRQEELETMIKAELDHTRFMSIRSVLV